MKYTIGDKIIVNISDDIVVVEYCGIHDELRHPDDTLFYANRYWIRFLDGDENKYHIGSKQVIGKYDPMKPIKYMDSLNFKIIGYEKNDT